jgi:periplasmic divalent cation tolerance protein
MTDAIQITTTTGTRDQAERIAYELVVRRLAACAQITGPAESTYRWQGRLEIAREEWLCTAKTTMARYAAAEQTIRELHTYEAPEIIAVPICAGSEQYLDWLRTEVSEQDVAAPTDASA